MTSGPKVTLYGWRNVKAKPIPLDGKEVLEFRIALTSRIQGETFLAYYDPSWGGGRGCWFYQNGNSAVTAKRMDSVAEWRPTGILLNN